MAFEWMSKDEVTSQTFNKYDSSFTGELTAERLQVLHAEIRDGGISLAQVKASIDEVCATDACDKDELFDVLSEMDRRYFLVRDLRWEFAMLDRERKGTISERSAKFLFQAVHDDFFSQRRWVKFLRSRAAPGSEISFAEIEVPLCNIPSLDWLEEEKEDEEKEKEEQLRKKQEREHEKETAKKKAEAKAKFEEETEKRKREAAKRREADDEARKKAEEKEKKRRLSEAKDAEEKLRLEQQERQLQEKKEKENEEERQRNEEEEIRRQEEERKKKQEEEAQAKWKKEELLKQQQLEKEKEEKGRHFGINIFGLVFIYSHT